MATRSGDKVSGRRKARRGRAPADDDTGVGTAVVDAPVPPAADTTSIPTMAPGVDTATTGVVTAVAGGTGPVTVGDPVVEQAWTDRAAHPFRHHQEWGQQPLAHQNWGWRTPEQSSWVDGGDSHLQPFTSTAQVPAVGRHFDPARQHLESTGVVPAVVAWQPRPEVPVVLRTAVWLVALMLVVGVAGLVVHHVRPQWLRSLEVTSTSTPTGTTPPSHSATGNPRNTRTTTPARRSNATVNQTSTGVNTATLAVASSQYNVVVTTQAPCWILVTGPASFKPLFEQTMPANANEVFASSQGQLTVQLGASRVVVQVQIGGKTVPGWQFTPSAVPFTMNFKSSG